MTFIQNGAELSTPIPKHALIRLATARAQPYSPLARQRPSRLVRPHKSKASSMGVQKAKFDHLFGHNYTSRFLATHPPQMYHGRTKEHRFRPSCLLHQMGSRSPYLIRPCPNNQHPYPRLRSWPMVFSWMEISLRILHRLNRTLLMTRVAALPISKLKVRP